MIAIARGHDYDQQHSAGDLRDVYSIVMFSLSIVHHISKLGLMHCNRTTHIDIKNSAKDRIYARIRHAFPSNPLTKRQNCVCGSSCHFYHGNGRP